jgi:hypothetical protein
MIALVRYARLDSYKLPPHQHVPLPFFNHESDFITRGNTEDTKLSFEVIAKITRKQGKLMNKQEHILINDLNKNMSLSPKLEKLGELNDELSKVGESIYEDQ